MRRSPDEIETNLNSITFPFFWIVDAFTRLLVCVAIVATASYFLIPKNSGTVPETSKLDLVEIARLDHSEFEQLLHQYDRETLSHWLTQPEPDASSTTPDRRIILVNRILAASQVGKSPMRSLKVFGISKELQLRTLVALLDLDSDRFDAGMIQELDELSDLYEGVEFPDQDELTDQIKERAGVGKIVSKFINSVEQQSSEFQDRHANSALEKLSELDQNSLISRESRKTLASLLRLAKKRVQKLNRSLQHCNRLESLIAKVNQSNRKRIFEEFAKLDCAAASAPKLEYLTAPKNPDRFFVDFENKLNRVLQSDQLSREQFDTIFDQLDLLIRAGWTRSGQRLLSEVVALMKQNGNFPLLEQQALEIQSQLAWIGKPVVLDGVKDTANREFDFKNRRQRIATILVYLPMVEDRFRQSKVKLIQMIRVYNSLVNSNNLELCGILVHQSDELAAMEKAKELMIQLKPIEFLHVNLDSEAGTNVRDYIAYEDLPAIVIVDSISRVVAVNPRPKQSVDIINLLRKQANSTTRE